MPFADDDVAPGYLQQRQIHHELNSPGMRALINSPVTRPIVPPDRQTMIEAQDASAPSAPGPDHKPLPGAAGQFKKAVAGQLSEDELQAEMAGVQQSQVDLPSAIAGGFGAPAWLGMKQGLRLAPTLYRSIASAIAAGTGEVPVGMVTERVEEKFPKLALPFTVLAGAVSGMTVERAIETGVKKVLGSADAAKIGAEALKVKKALEAGKVEDEATAAAVRELNAIAQDVVPVTELPPRSLKGLGKTPDDLDADPQWVAGKTQGDRAAAFSFLQSHWTQAQTDEVAAKLDAPANAVFVSIPSTSRQNVHPVALGEHLAETFQAKFLNGDELLTVAHGTESKKIPFHERKFYPRQYQPKAIEQLKYLSSQGHEVVVVEDIITSGGSVGAFVRTLKENGIPVKQVVRYFGADDRLAVDQATFDKLKKAVKNNPWVPADARQLSAMLTRADARGIIKQINAAKNQESRDELARKISGLLDQRTAGHVRESTAKRGDPPGHTGGENSGYGGFVAGVQAGPGVPVRTHVPGSLDSPDLATVIGDSSRPLVEILDEAPELSRRFLSTAAPDPLPDKALNINFARLETTEDVELIIARTAEAFAPEINAARRNVQTHEQTKALADLLGMTPDQLLSRRSGQAYNAGQALAARKVLVASAESLSVLGRKIASRQATDIDKAAFQKQLATHYAIQAQVSGMTAEAGRALNAFKILAKSDAGRVKQIDEMMRRLDGANVSTEHLAEMIAGLDSAEGLNRFVRDAQKATGWDMFIEAWINALLSSPVTHAANTISNAITAVWQIPERGLAAGIGRLTGSDAIAANEAGQMAYGLVEGFKDGIKLAAKTLRTGDEPELFNKAETYRQRAISAKNFGMQDGSTAARAVDLVGNMVRMPGRLLASEDSFFKSVGYRMELRALALRLATVEGLDGQAFKNRIAELIENPPDSIQLGAIDAARYVTFTKELGEAGRAGQKYLSKIPALRLIVPFVQTPVNIVKFAGERTPLALISKNVRADIAAGGARRDLALARLASGSMVMSAAAVAVLEGKITGGGPENPELKAALRRQGWQPYSLKIGDTYYAYNRLEPLGMLMGIAADATEIISQSGEHEAMEVACAAVAAIAKNVTSKTWLRGAADALDVLDDPERNVKKFLQNYIGTIVPAGVAAIEKTVDPTVRSTYSDQGFFYEVANHVKSRVPGWSKELPPKRDLWGNPIAGEGSLGPDFISPLHMSTAEESPIDAALVADKIRLAPARKVQSFRGVPVALTPAEHDRFVVLENTIDLPQTGMPLKPSLDRLVQSREYERADPDIRERMVRQHVHAARELAKMALFDEARQIQDIVIEMQTRSQP